MSAWRRAGIATLIGLAVVEADVAVVFGLFWLASINGPLALAVIGIAMVCVVAWMAFTHLSDSEQRRSRKEGPQ
jgi:ABC-type bacteriocin/lantibiotic exporter with double-glycine peptidase domain